MNDKEALKEAIFALTAKREKENTMSKCPKCNGSKTCWLPLLGRRVQCDVCKGSGDDPHAKIARLREALEKIRTKSAGAISERAIDMGRLADEALKGKEGEEMDK